MKIRKVRIWEKGREKRHGTEVRNVPREFNWSKTQSIKVEDFGWLRLFISKANGERTVVSIPREQIESVEIYEVPDDVEPSDPAETKGKTKPDYVPGPLIYEPERSLRGKPEKK